jgi:hypothetical protein
LKMLKTMKKKEITGNDEMELDEEDMEGDSDTEKYDQKMKEMLSNYDDNIAVEDEEKPTFSDIDKDYNEEDDVKDWDNWTGGDGGRNLTVRRKVSTWIVIFS